MENTKVETEHARYVTAAEYARLRGVTPQRVSNLTRCGKIELTWLRGPDEKERPYIDTDVYPV